MKSITRLIGLGSIAALLVLPTSAALADDSDIFGANIQPNVVIMIDDSGSMADSAPSNSFDLPAPNGSAPYYTTLNRCGSQKNQTCDSVKVYKSGSSSTYTSYANDVPSVNSSAARNALNSTGSWSGKISGSTVNLFTGNYLNYLYGPCASGGACTKPEMQIAQEVINGLLDSVQGVRFGSMTFYYGSSGQRGARMVSQVGSSVSTMKAAVNGLSPTGDTPLGDALWDGGHYYKGAALNNGNTYTSPIQLECQPNFVIMITDGMQTSGSRSMVDSGSTQGEATKRFTQGESAARTGVQSVIVHTGGFGITVNTTQAESASAYADLSK